MTKEPRYIVRHLQHLRTTCVDGHVEDVKPTFVADVGVFGSASDFCQRAGCGKFIYLRTPYYGDGRGDVERLDRKFKITAVSLEHERLHTEADSVLFLAKDRAFLAALAAYRAECVRLEAEDRGLAATTVDASADSRGVSEKMARQLVGIDLLIERVARWQREHPDLLKLPDVDLTAPGDDVVRPNE